MFVLGHVLLGFLPLIRGTMLDWPPEGTEHWVDTTYVTNKQIIGQCSHWDIRTALQVRTFPTYFQTEVLNLLAEFARKSKSDAPLSMDQILEQIVVPEESTETAESIAEYLHYLIGYTKMSKPVHAALLEYNQDPHSAETAVSIWKRLSLYGSDITCPRMVFWYNTAIRCEYGYPVDLLSVHEEPDEFLVYVSRGILENVVVFFQQMLAAAELMLVNISSSPHMIRNKNISGEPNVHALSESSGAEADVLLHTLYVLLENIATVCSITGMDVFRLLGADIPYETFSKVWTYVFERMRVPASLHELLLAYNADPRRPETAARLVTIHHLRFPNGPHVNADVVRHWYDNVIRSHAGRAPDSLAVTEHAGVITTSQRYLVNILRDEIAILRRVEHISAVFYIRPIPFEFVTDSSWRTHLLSQLLGARQFLEAWAPNENAVECLRRRFPSPSIAVEYAARVFRVKFIVTKQMVHSFLNLHLMKHVSEFTPVDANVLTQWLHDSGNRLHQTFQQIGDLYRVLVGEREVGTMFNAEYDLVYEGLYKGVSVFRPDPRFMTVLLEREKQKVGAAIAGKKRKRAA